MEERKPEAEIAEEDLEQVTGGGSTTASTPSGAVSNVIKTNSDTQGGIISNIK